MRLLTRLLGNRPWSHCFILTAIARAIACGRYTFYAYLVMAAIDFLWARRFVSRWFQIHTIANTVIAALCVKDTWFILSDPLRALATDETSQLPLAFVFALHLYHMTAPGMNLHFVDYLHHISMVIVGNPLLMFSSYGPLMNYNFMFVCGLPGGIDYGMLVCVKEGIMRPLTEKHYNNILNVWCRAPFLCFCVILSWVQIHIQRPPTYVIVCRCLLMALQIWNAQYFMARVCGNYFVTRFKVSQARKKAEKDGDVALAEKLTGPRKKGNRRARADSVTEAVGAADEHPLPSAFEGVLEPRRNVRFNQFSRAWDYVRGGS